MPDMPGVFGMLGGNPMTAQMLMQGGPGAAQSLIQGGLLGAPGAAPPPVAGAVPPPVAGLPMPPPVPAAMPGGAPIPPPPAIPQASPTAPAAPTTDGPEWLGWQNNIFKFEGGSGGAGNGGGPGQFEPSIIQAFDKANPQFANTPITDPAKQQALYKFEGQQNVSAFPQAANDPGLFYAAYSLGPAAAKALASADPNAPAAEVVGKLKDGATLIHGNPELFQNGATVKDALTRAATISLGLWSPDMANQSSPGAATAAQGAAPQVGGGNLIDKVLGLIPQAPQLAKIPGIATNPLLALGAGMLSSEPRGSAAQMIGSGVSALMNSAKARALLNDQIALKQYGLSMDKAKIGAQLALENKMRPASYMPVRLANGDYGEALYSPLTGNVTMDDLGAGVTPGQIAEKQVQANLAGATAVGRKLGGEAATDYTEGLDKGQEAASTIPTIESLQTAIMKQPQMFNQGQFKNRLVTMLGTQGFLPKGAWNQTTGTVEPLVMKQLTTGELGDLKEEGGFRYMAGPELKAIAGAVAGNHLTAEGASNVLEVMKRADMREQFVSTWMRTPAARALLQHDPAAFQAKESGIVQDLLNGKYGSQYETVSAFDGTPITQGSSGGASPAAPGNGGVTSGFGVPLPAAAQAAQARASAASAKRPPLSAFRN